MPATTSSKTVDRKKEYADVAMQMLRRAVRAGYKDATRMAKDRDLDALRDRDDFKNLLESLSAALISLSTAASITFSPGAPAHL
jgi:hypothetical protein